MKKLNEITRQLGKQLPGSWRIWAPLSVLTLSGAAALGTGAASDVHVSSRSSQTVHTSSAANPPAAEPEQPPANDEAQAAPAPFQGENQTSGDATSTNSTSTTVTVNGQNIPVPDNGAVQQTLDTSGGQVNVSLEHNSSSSSNESHVSTNLHVDSHNSSSSQLREEVEAD